MIGISQYFRAYAGHAALTPAIAENAIDLLDRVNDLLGRAALAGWVPTVNPATGNWISGEDNGGWRPPDCPVGAPLSAHKQGQAIDIADPDGWLDKFCLTEAGLDALVELGLWLEHPGWTDGWCHLQSVPPRSSPRVRVFIPSLAPPMTTIYGRAPVYREVA